jgi:hypothetical protein
MRDAISAGGEEMKSTSGRKKEIKTSTGLLIIFAAAVIIFGGCYTYAMVFAPQPDYTVTTTNNVVHKTTDSATKDWKTYTNSRVNYSFEYPSSNLKLNLDETIKYPSASAADSKTEDLVQFATSTTTYSIRADISGHATTVEAWITGASENPVGDGFPSKNISDYKKITVGDNTAYTNKNSLITFVVVGTKYYTISAHSGTAIKTGSDTIYSHLLSSFKFTTSDTVTAPTTTTPAAASQTYTNPTYGFSLTIPNSWTGYKVKSVSIEGAVASFSFELPTTDSFYQADMSNSDAGYADVFSVNVMNKTDWEGDGEAFGSKIAENSSYVFSSGSSQADPNEAIFTTARSQIQTIIDTFTLK